jgi:hypothetical protein
MAITIERAGVRARQSQARATTEANRLATELVREQIAKEKQAIRWLKEMGFFELSEAQRHGAMLGIEQGLEDDRTLARWDEASRKAVAADEARAARPLARLYIAFPGKVPIALRRELVAAGLQYIKLEDHYQGEMVWEDAVALAAKHGGEAGRLNGPVVLAGAAE